ncbi:MAG TPA: LysM peptidoglycan-binding domain-containing protein [Phycisphaerales bacterium]|nr:LysM peptidoglycan-binding domain-containing protein [Phycisphaerales bacterium]
MATGTKVFLAVAALLVVVLIAYYQMNTSDTPLVSLDAPADVIREEPLIRSDPLPMTPEVRQPMAMPELEHQPEPEFLEEDIAALDPIAPAAEGAGEPTDSVLPDHEPVTPVDSEPLETGKDAPPSEPPTPQPEPVKDDAPATPAPQPSPQPAPVPTPAPASPLTPPPTTPYTVKEGDTLSSIAANWFGDAGKWDLIAKANPFVDPDRLSVGQVLRLPPKDAQREEIPGRLPAQGSAPVVYVVRSGDTLSRIATAYYGSPLHWRLIYDANKAVIGENANALRVGMRLTIPPAPKPATPPARSGS